MTSRDRSCANCAHYRPPVASLPGACNLANRLDPLPSDICDEHQTTHEATAARAEAIARGAISRARGQ